MSLESSDNVFHENSYKSSVLHIVSIAKNVQNVPFSSLFFAKVFTTFSLGLLSDKILESLNTGSHIS